MDGRLVSLSAASVPLLDRGYQLGDGIFETMRARHGRVFALPAHLQRLREGLRASGIHPLAARAAERALQTLTRAATRRVGDELRLRLVVTAGVAEPFEGQPGRWAVTAWARPFHAYPNRYYEEGIRVITSRIRALLANPLAPAKAIGFLPHVVARRDARRSGADDALILNERGRLAEATTSNLIAARRRRLWSPGPREGALDGVTRRLLLRWARAHGYAVRESLTAATLRAADELALINTLGGVVPVRAWKGEGKRFLGPRGPVYRALRSVYERMLDD